MRPAPVARARRHRARRADPAGPPEPAACLPQRRSRLLPGRYPQPRSGHQPPAARGRRLSLRGLPGLPARLLHVLRRERGLDGPALRDHRGRGPRPGPGRGGLVAVGHGRGALPVPGRRGAGPGHAAGKRAGGGAVGHIVPGVRRPARDAGDPGADLQSAERLWHVEARRGDGRRQPRAPVRHPHRRAQVQHRPGSPAVGLQRLLRRVPHLLPELPAGPGSHPLRGRRGDPRLRQHRRRGGRQRPGLDGRPRGRASLQRRRRQSGHYQRIRRYRPGAVRVRASQEW